MIEFEDDVDQSEQQVEDIKSGAFLVMLAFVGFLACIGVGVYLFVRWLHEQIL